MSNLSGDVGELRFTVQITRKATGQVEEIELVGRITEEQVKEIQDGCNSFHGGEKRSD